MTITVECGNCGKAYEMADDKAGRKFRCRECETVIHVPESPGEPIDHDSVQQQPLLRRTRTDVKAERRAHQEKQDLLEIAKWQKCMIWMILVSIGVMYFAAEHILPAAVGGGIVQFYFVYKLTSAPRLPLVLVFGVFIPYLGLIPLLVINQKATRRLQENGFQVGLMGVRTGSNEK